MKKILFFIPNLMHGGAEKVLVNLVNNLHIEKYDITLQTLFDIGVNKKYLKSATKEEYGRVYGMLSEGTHISLKTPEKFITEKDGEIFIRGRSGKMCNDETEVLILLYAIYIDVIEYAINKYKKQLSEEETVYYKEFIKSQVLAKNFLFKSYNDQSGLTEMILGKRI